MSIKECIDSYSFRVSEQETMFRDLFGKCELDEARKTYFASGMNKVMKYDLWGCLQKILMNCAIINIDRAMNN